MAKVAFIGLGVMGYPMAGHLACQGHEVTVYNRTAARALQWQEQYGGEIAATPREAALGAELVMVCVGNDDDLRQVVLGAEGALAGMAVDAAGAGIAMGAEAGSEAAVMGSGAEAVGVTGAVALAGAASAALLWPPRLSCGRYQ